MMQFQRCEGQRNCAPPFFYTNYNGKYHNTIQSLINLYQNLMADSWKCGFVTNDGTIMEGREEVIRMVFVNSFLYAEKQQAVTH